MTDIYPLSYSEELGESIKIELFDVKRAKVSKAIMSPRGPMLPLHATN